jgi:hypothetical protein
MALRITITDETQAARFVATAFALIGQSDARITVEETNEEVTIDFFDSATQEKILDFFAVQDTSKASGDGKIYSFEEITAFLFPQSQPPYDVPNIER